MLAFGQSSLLPAFYPRFLTPSDSSKRYCCSWNGKQRCLMTVTCECCSQTPLCSSHLGRGGWVVVHGCCGIVPVGSCGELEAVLQKSGVIILFPSMVNYGNLSVHRQLGSSLWQVRIWLLDLSSHWPGCGCLQRKAAILHPAALPWAQLGLWPVITLSPAHLHALS